MQISSQKSKSVSLRPKNEKKITTISFFVTEICLLENQRQLSRQFGGRCLSSNFKKKKKSLYGGQIVLVEKLTFLALLPVLFEHHTIYIFFKLN